MKRELFIEIIESEFIHAYWLNTLAFLEHIGSRKLIKCHDSSKLNLDILEHIAEESRHAAFLKKLLVKNYPSYCPNFESKYLLGNPEKYFQDLDAGVADLLINEKEVDLLTYAYVSLLIEERALQVYGTYQEALSENSHCIRVHSIIGEEKKHLSAMKDLLQSKDRDFNRQFKYLSDLEVQLYLSFCQRIEMSISQLKEVENETSYLETIHTNAVVATITQS